MHIPEGYKLVPVDLLERVVCLDNSFRRHRQAQHDLVTFLAAPVPPQAEVQPVAYQFQDRDGKWCGFVNERHYHSTVADGSWPIRALYTHSDAGVANSNHKLLMDGACGEIALLEQERDALQQRLTDAEKRAVYLEGLLREATTTCRVNDLIISANYFESALKPVEVSVEPSFQELHGLTDAEYADFREWQKRKRAAAGLGN